jgi:crossover junction endodeoxyribonuclease RuvC
MTRVLGLDLSLTATGYAYNDEVTGVFRSKNRGPRRLAEIRGAVLDYAYESDIVVLEGYSYASANQAHQVGELGGVVRVALFDKRIPFVDVAPAVLKKFATGKGNAPKDAMIAAAIRRFDFEGTDNNEADAWMLREMGLAAYGSGRYVEHGATLLTVAGREALGKVTWPKLDIVEQIPRVTEAERVEAQFVREVIAEANSSR